VSIGSGTAELELQSNNGRKSGKLSFGRKGHITFGNLSDIFGINGSIFTLVGSVQGLASAVAANPSGAYALANSYDASQDGTYTTIPVPNALTGTFEGLGNAVSNLSMTVQGVSSYEIGMFYMLGSNEDSLHRARIADFRLDNVNVQVTNAYTVGGMVGWNQGIMSNDHVTGTVSGTEAEGIGGLAGGNIGEIERSDAHGDFYGDSAVGGLVGWNFSTIRLSHSGGHVTCKVSKKSKTKQCSMVGGLVGMNGYANGAIAESFSTAKVTADGPQAGLVYPIAGGLVGLTEDATVIDNSYSTGSVTSNRFAGGLLGGDYWSTNTPNISNSYAIGALVAKQSGSIGGFVCQASANYSNDYWDTDTSGTSNATCNGSKAGISGLTTAQLQSGLPAGFDPSIWAEDSSINNGLPYLIANPPPK